MRPWAAIALAMSLTVSGLAHAGVAIGDTPPERLGNNQQGVLVRTSDFRGKVVVVTFWASWCGYCRKELPVLAGLQEAGKGQVEVVAVNSGDDRDVYRALVRRLKDVRLTMTRDANGDISRGYGVNTIPRLFMLDRQGRVAYVHSGYSEAESLDAIIGAANRLLAMPAADPGPGSVRPAAVDQSASQVATR